MEAGIRCLVEKRDRESDERSKWEEEEEEKRYKWKEWIIFLEEKKGQASKEK